MTRTSIDITVTKAENGWIVCIRKTGTCGSNYYVVASSMFELRNILGGECGDYIWQQLEANHDP